jgi:hypothetical protein
MSYVEHPPGTEQWTNRLASWSKRLHSARLDGLVGVLLDVVEPLSPLGAQLLWISQPTLGLLVPREEIGSLARLLEQPDGMAWLREQLTGKDHHGK